MSRRGTAHRPVRSIARVGPGTGGDAAFTQIDPDLRRPTTDELVLAIQCASASRGSQLELARITKREQPLLGFVDTGVPASAYTTFQVPDPSFVPGSPVGAPQVTVYNRPPGSYGRDRYLLTNQTGDPAKSWGARAHRARVDRPASRCSPERTLTEANGPAAAVGFLPTENDQDVLGNLFVDPNAATNARGQLFPGPFAHREDRRHLPVSLAHPPRRDRPLSGRPAVRAPRRRSGSHAGTDGRALRTRTAGRRSPTRARSTSACRRCSRPGASQVAAVLDVYNLPNLGNEVTEYVVSGTMFRTPTALQPPRTVAGGRPRDVLKSAWTIVQDPREGQNVRPSVSVRGTLMDAFVVKMLPFE